MVVVSETTTVILGTNAIREEPLYIGICTGLVESRKTEGNAIV